MTDVLVLSSGTEASINVLNPQIEQENPPWYFRGRCVRVVDGDTYDILCDCGFSIYHKIRVRLRGVDTPEVYGAKACEEGRIASKVVSDTILDKEVAIYTYKNAPSTFNRWEADVFFKDENGTVINLAKFLVLNGYATLVEGYSIREEKANV
jgi:endonuclease YncB( thermonuclease family)